MHKPYYSAFSLYFHIGAYAAVLLLCCWLIGLAAEFRLGCRLGWENLQNALYRIPTATMLLFLVYFAWPYFMWLSIRPIWKQKVK